MRITKEDLIRIIEEELEAVFNEDKGTKKDACYSKVKSRYKVWPSAYASGALVKCRKVGAKNWGNSKKEGLDEEFKPHDMYDPESGKKYDADVEQDHIDMSEKGYTHIDPKKVEKILRDEGGAAGLDPFLKEFGEDKKEDILKILEDMPTVKKHENGDYILDDNKDVDLSEKKLTKKDKQQKEKFVKGMKKNKKGFEKSYGKDAESVMYATATKMGLKKP